MSVFVRLLGPPRVEIDGTRIEPEPTRVSAALLYLAYRGGWVPRDEFLPLLWPEQDEEHARASLRQLVVALRGCPFAVGLEVERRRLRWPIPTDIAGIEADAAAEGPSPGSLLDGFRLPGAEAFDEWLELERASVRERLRVHTLERIERALADGRADDALVGLERWLEAEPLDEGAVRLHLETCVRTGRLEQGRRRYRAFATRLLGELGFEPSPEMRRVRAALEDGATAPGAPPNSGGETALGDPPESGSAGRGRTRWSTPFVGRDEEIRILDTEVVPNAGAVVTLVGAGGMGKTRLAHDAAGRLAQHFPGGVTVVSARGATSVEEVLASLADSLGVASAPGMPTEARAAAGLRGPGALLVIDNLEDVDGVEEAVARLRDGHQAHAWLLTSRRHLRLPGAITVEVGGLGLGDATVVDPPPATRLFLDAARRLGVDVPVSARGTVDRLVERLGGMPLALELAAGWTRLLPVSGILERLEGGELPSAAPADPRADRHADVALVFGASWEALRPGERHALARLSVFAGGATVGAAETVAGVDLTTLARLRDASMVGVSPAGRIVHHPVVEAFVRRRVVADGLDLEATRRRHAEHYLALLERLECEGQAGDGTAIDTLAHEHGNIEAAWTWAIDHEMWPPLEWGGVMLILSYWHVGRLERWYELIAAALERAPRGSQTWAVLEQYHADGDWWHGRFDIAYRRRRDALELLRRHGDSFRIAWALFHLSLTLGPLGRADEARAALVEANDLLASIDEVHIRAMVVNHLHARSTDLAEREAWYRVGEEVRRRSGSAEHDAKAWFLRAADVVRERGAWTEALRLVDAAVALRHERLPDDIDTTIALAHAAEFRMGAGDVDGALAFAREALERGRPFGITSYFDVRWPVALVARALWLLGEAGVAAELMEREAPPSMGAHLGIESLRADMALAADDVVSARRAVEAARTCVTTGSIPHEISLLEVRVLLGEGRSDHARALLERVLDREAEAPSVPEALSALAVAAPLLPAQLALRALQTVAAHPGTPYGVRAAPSVRAAPAVRTAPPGDRASRTAETPAALRALVATVRAELAAEAEAAPR